MKLFLLTRTDQWDYDEFDGAIVCAESLEDARQINPDEWSDQEELAWRACGAWTAVENVVAEEIGEAAPHIKRGVVLGSFRAG